MASTKYFLIDCTDKDGNAEEHLVIIDTEYVEDPDKKGSGTMIPAPHLCFPNHCTCDDAHHGTPQHKHCECDGQKDFEAAMTAIKMLETDTPSCAQFLLEFAGDAPKRVSKGQWWKPRQESEKVTKVVKEKATSRK